MNTFIDTEAARDLIGLAQFKNQILTVHHVKLNGDLRKHALRICSKNNHNFQKKPNLISIKELAKQPDGSFKTQYRSFDMSRLVYIAADNKVLRVV